MDYLKIKKEFNSLSEIEQWAFILLHKKQISLSLDNDNTTFTFDNEDKTDDRTRFLLKDDIGDRAGVEHLLQLIGINAKSV